MMRLSPKAARYADAARKRFGKLTPFRLGIVVGEQSDAVRIPWTDERSLRWYADGLEHGAEMRRRRDAQRIEARSDETPQAVQPEGREPAPKDAPKGVPHDPTI